VRLHASTTVFDALAALRQRRVSCAPVFGDDELRAEPLGFLFMIDIVTAMLKALRLAFRLPATDPLSIQMRLDRINESASVRLTISMRLTIDVRRPRCCRIIPQRHREPHGPVTHAALPPSCACAAELSWAGLGWARACRVSRRRSSRA
jgi:hypothetical protein